MGFEVKVYKSVEAVAPVESIAFKGEDPMQWEIQFKDGATVQQKDAAFAVILDAQTVRTAKDAAAVEEITRPIEAESAAYIQQNLRGILIGLLQKNDPHRVELERLEALVQAAGV